MEATACRSPFNPPPLLESAPFGHIAQPPRELAARRSKENQGKKAWISLDSFGRMWTFQSVTAETREKIRRGLNSRIRLRATGSAPSESVDRQLVSTERYIPCFWICQRIGLRPSARRSDQDEPRGSRRQMSFRPGGDAVRGSSSVVVRLATTLPPKPVARRTRRPGPGAGAEALSAELKARGSSC